jgi:hypothetical protein
MRRMKLVRLRKFQNAAIHFRALGFHHIEDESRRSTAAIMHDAKCRIITCESAPNFDPQPYRCKHLKDKRIDVIMRGQNWTPVKFSENCKFRCCFNWLWLSWGGVKVRRRFTVLGSPTQNRTLAPLDKTDEIDRPHFRLARFSAHQQRPPRGVH